MVNIIYATTLHYTAHYGPRARHNAHTINKYVLNAFGGRQYDRLYHMFLCMAVWLVDI